MKGFCIKLTALVLLAAPMGAVAVPVTVGDTQWMQPADVMGFSWNDVAAVCDPATGVCGSTLLGGTIDLEGWIWASVSDVLPLFYALTPLTSPDTELIGDLDVSSFAFTSLFDLTGSNLAFNITGIWGGYTRDDFGGGFLGLCQVAEDTDPLEDLIRCGPSPVALGYDFVSSRNGQWFYRNILVSEPGTLALLFISLAGMVHTRRRCLAGQV